ncbi:ABC transporter substrate-binding protein [Bradyrhizobium sp. dw_411]|uniref:ABC transporter substrate-binding protein n=1 Tax=Bradyrhizobium sp. dw_411 TaxID=2720082 RepID=UPI001BCE0738|nr:ABC transporter substrate-binding protein [Bradyrhizobium sp. dw_411]
MEDLAMPIRNPQRREFLQLAGALAGASLLPGLTETSFAQGSGSKHLVVSLVPEPSGIYLLANNPSLVVTLNVNDGLVTYDNDFKPVPQLAESWTQSEDAKTITFKLRAGVKWHDGKPFTAADVKFSVELTKKSSPVAAATYAHLTAVETPDDLTVVLKFDHPSQALWAVLDGAKTQILPHHLYEGTDPNTNPWNNKPIGTGAFIFQEWVRGSHIRLTRNPDYWDKGKPLLDEITFRIIPDAGARGIALETGEVQYAPLPAIPLVEARRIRSKPGKLIAESRGWEANAPIYYFDFNLEREVFRDIRVRKAFAYAIDRKVLANNGFFGFAKPATGPVPSYQPNFYTPDTERYPYSVEKAEALLEESGLRKDAQGIRLRVDNLPIPYGEDYVRTAQLIQQQLKRVGIDLQLRNFDVGTWITKIARERDFDTLSTFGASFADPQIGVYRRYWSKARQTASGGNNSGYVSAEADKLIEASLIEGDVERRRSLIHELQKLVESELPSISLLELEFVRILSADLAGANVTPFGAFASFTDLTFKA